MRRKGSFLLVVAVALVAAIAVPAGPVTAQSGGSCTVSGGVVGSPGLSMTPSSGTYNFTSNTTLTCVGVISGTAVAGQGFVTSPGTFGDGALAGIFGGDTCVQGSGHGTFNANVPIVGGGSLNVTGEYDFIRIGSLVEIDGNANGSPLVGFFQFTPDLGQDCFLTPVVSANVTGQAFVAG